MAGKKAVIPWQFYLGFILIVTGGLFLADQLLGIQIMRYFWPFLVILLGITFFVGMILAGKRGAGLAIPGSIITTAGLLFLIQNTYNLWVTWSYAWGLMISATGLGLLIMNMYLKRVGLRWAAGLLIGIGLILFVIFGVLFEILLDIVGTSVESGLFLGGGLVLLGLFLIFSRGLFSRTSYEEKEEPDRPIDADFTDIDDNADPAQIVRTPLPEGAAFTGLHFKSFGEVTLTQGDICHLKIEGRKALLDKVKAEIKGGMLSITFLSDDSDWAAFSRLRKEDRIRYFVSAKNIDKIDLTGTGNIQAATLKGEALTLVHAGAGKLVLDGIKFHDLTVDLSGLGEVSLAGEVDSQHVDLSGAGSYQGETLKSRNAEINISGAGSARVWVEETLKAVITGAGKVRYKGSPSLEESCTGLGSIKPL